MSVATQFTPLASAAGGALIGLAAVLTMLVSGRIAGVSGFIARLLPPKSENDPLDALAFLVGLAAAPIVWTFATSASITQTVTDNLPLAAAAGLLAGFGGAYAGGCTSGHGVCGLSRFSANSLIAVLVFMAVAAATVFVTRHVAGGI